MEYPGVIPPRPLTVAELLDGAVALLRRHARPLLATALVLGAAEQAVLYPLRRAAEVTAPWYFPPYSDRLGEYWLLLGVGFATEATAIALLGGLAARAGRGALIGHQPAGEQPSDRALLAPRGGRFGAILVAALAVGVIAGLAALAGLVPWIFAYGLLGLTVPALVIDGRGAFGALGRSLVLSWRLGLRALGVRLVGYFAWLAIRIALGAGGIAALKLVLPATERWLTLISIVTWLAVNAVAYATLACLDTVLHLETRMRTEGLDIALGRTRRQGRPPSLAVPR